jgi:hypothetical protein
MRLSESDRIWRGVGIAVTALLVAAMVAVAIVGGIAFDDLG